MAKKFLELVAEDLLKTYGNNLSKVTVVIPGKRARLFMNQYLAQQCDKPVWAPRYQTIDELFLELSPYTKAEQIETICELYKIYCTVVDEPKSIDEFYSWGEILLSDFDDIDKHLAPAEKIFANVYDLQAIHENYLTEEQVEVLEKFFNNFSRENNTELKERFLRLWSVMHEIYTGLKEQLMQKGHLYAGALYREVVERFRKPGEKEQAKLQEMQQRVYAFVGFNVVDECEESLFRLLGEEHTRFYWDYDLMYMETKHDTSVRDKHREIKESPWEASLFLRQNLAAFPNRLPREYFDNLKSLKDITFIATSTDNAQARYIPTWIAEELTTPENDTAIVLCDEHLLQPVLHSLPEDMPEQINVTMGFPITDTPIYSFLSIVTSMQIDGFDRDGDIRKAFEEKVVRHPYYKIMCDSLGEEKTKVLLFERRTENLALLDYLQEIIGNIGSHYAKRINEAKGKKETPEALDEDFSVYDQLYAESLFQCNKIINRLITIIGDIDLAMDPSTLRRLLRNILVTTSIPFHGEPAIGMQVMGLMETRNLDFRHLLMLNVGEGKMPKKSDDNSFVPYPLREAFGMTTIRHRISVFAYYFFRLLQRAEHVTLMYNENSSGVKNNEMSRFMRQLMAETDLPIKHIRLTPENDPGKSHPTVMAEKTPKIVQMLRERYSKKVLAPTAINTYLKCPLSFYYKYVAGMYAQDAGEEGITAAEMGTYFHEAAEKYYSDLHDKYGTWTFSKDILEREIKNQKHLIDCIEMGGSKCDSGLPMIIKDVILKYLLHLLRYDRDHAPVSIVSLEKEYHLYLDIAEKGEEPFNLKIGGCVDRLDSTPEGLQVIDYKTGGKPDSLPDMENMFTMKAPNAGYYLQTILYSIAVSKDKNLPVKPTLFYVHKASNSKEYDSSLMFKPSKGVPEIITDVRPIQEEFTERLKEKLREIFNPNINFTQRADESKCGFCEFSKLCEKKVKNK